jgi:signal transduction histidine kinase
MLDDLAGDLVARATSDSLRQEAQVVGQAIVALSRDVEQALALQRAFSTLLARSTTFPAVGTQSVWLSFGERATLWLVGVASVADGQRVLAVRAEPLLASLQAVRGASKSDAGNKLLEITMNAGGEPLGQDFPGLALTFEASDPAVLAGAVSLQRSFYLVALALVVSMTLFGAYLFWRDVQREVHLAEMRSQFVSSVSHELKTPLTAIRMFADTLLMGRSTRPEAREEYLETIVNESERLTRLLNNVLDFSKIEQGQKTYRLEPHSLGSIVRAAAKAMQYPLLQQGFDLRVHIDEHVPTMTADPDAIEQAILNLLSNAMKYSGQSRVIDLYVKRDGDRAVIAVTDRGVGIPAHEQTRIFEKFYRIAGPDRERIPGTGLGLTLVEHVARAHGGQVTVRSAPGEGSTFSLLLPLVHATADAPARKEVLA